jgi:hypothetical protein
MSVCRHVRNAAGRSVTHSHLCCTSTYILKCDAGRGQMLQQDSIDDLTLPADMEKSAVHTSMAGAVAWRQWVNEHRPALDAACRSEVAFRECQPPVTLDDQQ